MKIIASGGGQQTVIAFLENKCFLFFTSISLFDFGVSSFLLVALKSNYQTCCTCTMLYSELTGNYQANVFTLCVDV